MTGVLWGLLGATLIGSADCVARVTAQRVSMSVLLFAVMGLPTLVLTGWMATTGIWPTWHSYGWAASAASGLLNLIALFFLYSALANGPASIAAATASSFSVVLVTVNALAGHAFVWQQFLAIVIVFFGIAMLTRRNPDGEIYDAQHLQTTALLGLAAALAIAGRMFLAQEAGDALGSMQALYLNRAFAFSGVIALLTYESLVKRPRKWPSTRKMVWLVFLQALLETLALGSFLTGSEDGDRIGASIGFSSFAAVTALAAWIWLGEPIGWRRGFWMAWIALGVVYAIFSSPL